MGAEGVRAIATTLCLIRHGVTDWNSQGRLQGHSDIPLNELGIRQAEALARRLSREPWSALWSSDLLRARQTAEPILRYTGLPLQIDPQLRERCLGPLEGLTFEEVQRRFPGYPSAEVNLPGVESREQLRQRAMAVITRLVETHPGQRLLVVSHGAWINSVLAVVSGGRVGTGKTRLENASVSVIVGDGRDWDLQLVNDTRHLEELDLHPDGVELSRR